LLAQQAAEHASETGFTPPTDKGADNFLAGDGTFKPIPESTCAGGHGGQTTGTVKDFGRILTAAEETAFNVARADGRLLPDGPRYQVLKDFLMNQEDAGDFVIKDIGISRIMWTAFPTGEGEIYWTPNWNNNDPSTQNHMIVTTESGDFLRVENFPEIGSAWSNWNFRFRTGDWIFACSGYRGVQKFNVRTKEKLIYPIGYTNNADTISLAGDKVFYYASVFALGSIWVLDVDSLAWNEISVPSQAYRCPIVQGDFLYLVGGGTGFHEQTTANSVIRINIKTLEVNIYPYPENNMPVRNAIYHPIRQAFFFPRTTASTSLRIFQHWGGSPSWSTITGLPSRIHGSLIAVKDSVYVTSGSRNDTIIVELAFTNFWGQTVIQHTVPSGNYYSAADPDDLWGRAQVIGDDIYYNSNNINDSDAISVFNTETKTVRGQFGAGHQKQSFAFREQFYFFARHRLENLPLSKVDPVTLAIEPVIVPGLPTHWRANMYNIPGPGLFYVHWNEGTGQINSSTLMIGIHQTPELNGRKYIAL
jgi:hypothetical protein